MNEPKSTNEHYAVHITVGATVFLPEGITWIFDEDGDRQFPQTTIEKIREAIDEALASVSPNETDGTTVKFSRTDTISVYNVEAIDANGDSWSQHPPLCLGGISRCVNKGDQQ